MTKGIQSSILNDTMKADQLLWLTLTDIDDKLRGLLTSTMSVSSAAVSLWRVSAHDWECRRVLSDDRPLFSRSTRHSATHM